MLDQNRSLWPFIDLVLVSPDVMVRADSVVVLAPSGGAFAALHGGWMGDVDRARAAGAVANVAVRVRFRRQPRTTNSDYLTRIFGRAVHDDGVVQGVRLPTLDEPGGSAIEVRLAGWDGADRGHPRSDQRAAHTDGRACVSVRMWRWLLCPIRGRRRVDYQNSCVTLPSWLGCC